ncbi:glycosyltransferase family 4 protein [Tellurirhabdus bombi]|uniref:glycosyltransferase family 4 protein n=1 Tax=Tellurirhabdus bombi TaxID=2907205 RepID=UPI001F276FAF|nr:glycosyltransferase family 1 protein [Tellurirhabdus bombi]
MNILYVIPDLAQSGGGIRQYACALLRILAQDTANRYFVLHNENDELVLSTIQASSNLELIPVPIGRERSYEKLITKAAKAVNMLLKSRAVPVWTYLERLRSRYGIQVMYCPYPYIFHTKVQTVVTLHDVQELHFPAFFPPAVRAERAVYYMNVTELSTQLVVSYQHVKKDLIECFGRTPDNVQVCLLDMQNLWFEKFLTQKADPSPKSDLPTLPEKFVFYPAATWMHKNHIGLLESVAYLRDQYNIRISLVSTGHQTEHFGQIQQRIRELNLENQVFFLGIVSDAALFELYQKTHAVVVPTLYEAGSFPLMESMLMTIPVVCSNVTSLPETIGDSRFVFDPKNKVDMAEKLLLIFQNEEYREQNRANSRKQAHYLKNTGSLQILQKMYQRLAQNLPVAKN